MVRQTAGPKKPTGAERRKAKRVPATVPFRLVTNGKEEPFDLVDLSESGARIRCGHAVPAMTRIQVRILFPGERIGTKAALEFDTHGVVVWSHKDAGAKTFDTGVFFSELDERQRHLLRAFVGSHA
jgi:c-di-GMP-binding flagellar brake protein YcgR